MNARYDLAIVGSGFAGSLLAMIARQTGRSVVLIEKGRHPRFTIGESSTPLSNLLLEELASRYGLPRLLPLTRWGAWQRAYPELPCGLKRGFSFYHHRLHDPAPAFTRAGQLLVAASPRDEIADTHWYRAGVDHFFLKEAQAAGADYFDQVQLASMQSTDDGVTLEGTRAGRPVWYRAKFLVDATGPRGFTHRALGLSERPLPGFPDTQALYAHFSGVAQFDSHGADTPPYPVDDAALHHVFDGGWIWVLRFNNGITSAGAAVTQPLAGRLHLADGAPAWQRLLQALPAVDEQFANAHPVLPFQFASRVAFRSATAAGTRWAMLPSAAGFVDPLLSTGFALTLLGVARLAEAIEQDWETPRFAVRLQAYAAKVQREADAAARLIGALYGAMRNFPLFAALSLLYFAAVSFAETARRLDRHTLASSFLLCDDPVFGPLCERFWSEAATVRPGPDSNALVDRIRCAIEPFNVAGLGDPARRNWYPAEAADLLKSAHKLGVEARDVQNMLNRFAFHPALVESIHPML